MAREQEVNLNFSRAMKSRVSSATIIALLFYLLMVISACSLGAAFTGKIGSMPVSHPSSWLMISHSFALMYTGIRLTLTRVTEDRR
jgi:hypothetical protein